MNNAIDQLTNWFETHKGHHLCIHKEELAIGTNQISDHDQVTLKLENVSLRQLEKEDADHYLAPNELLLHGQGMIESKPGRAPLPQQVYEIPLVGEIKIDHKDTNIHIQTERARYTIHVQ